MRQNNDESEENKEIDQRDAQIVNEVINANINEAN